MLIIFPPVNHFLKGAHIVWHFKKLSEFLTLQTQPLPWAWPDTISHSNPPFWPSFCCYSAIITVGCIHILRHILHGLMFRRATLEQSCRLAEFLVFNSAFGRHSNSLIPSTLSSVGDCHVEIFMIWIVHHRRSPIKNSLWYENFNMTITSWW